MSVRLRPSSPGRFVPLIGSLGQRCQPGSSDASLSVEHLPSFRISVPQVDRFHEVAATASHGTRDAELERNIHGWPMSLATRSTTRMAVCPRVLSEAQGPRAGGIKRPPPRVLRTRPLPGWERETAPAKSKAPLITVATVGILLVVFIGKLLLGFVASHGVHFERARLKALTQGVGSSLDVSQVKALTGQRADEDTPGFQALVVRLNEIRAAHQEVRFTFLMGRSGNEIVFLLDSTDPASMDYSPPGEVYEEASPELVRSFTNGEPFVEGPVTDRWGTWVSGLAPIRDPSTGDVIAVMGMDINATRWNVTLGASRMLAYLIIALLFGVVVFFAKRVQALH